MSPTHITSRRIWLVCRSFREQWWLVIDVSAFRILLPVMPLVGAALAEARAFDLKRFERYTTHMSLIRPDI